NGLADGLKNLIRTHVPLKVAQRHTVQPVDGVLIQDVRIYTRAVPGPEVEQLMQGTRASWLAALPSDKRSAKERDELCDWWLRSLDGPSQSLTAKLSTLVQEEVAIKARGSVAHVMQERAEMPTAYVLFRGEYDKR